MRGPCHPPPPGRCRLSPPPPPPPSLASAQYGYISGYPLFRQCLARFLAAKYGQAVDPELLFVTPGVTGSLALIASLFVSRGDVVLCENPSYFLALSIFRDFGLRIVPCPLDDGGLDTDALAAMLAADPTLKPKFLYTIPAFQNPTGYNLSEARKAHLCRLAAQHDFVVLADEVYQLLGFTDAPAPSPPLCYYDTAEHVGAAGTPGHVFSIGSFAKILAPGMRLGWLQTSPAGAPLLARLFNCGQLDSSGAVNPVISGIVHAFIEGGHQEAHLAAVRAELTARANALVGALRAHLPPAARFQAPRGGYFIWIRLPHPAMTGAALLEACVARHKVRFQPGERFGAGLDNFIRLSFSYYSREDLVVGAERLGRGMAELLAALAAAPPAPLTPAPAPAPPAGLRLGVHGASGRLGSLILAAAGEAAPGVWGAATALPRGGAGAAGPPPAVVIDVSLPAGTAALVAALAAAPPPHAALVVGTTGELPLAALTAYAAKAPVVLCANFSTGVPLLLRTLRSLKGALPAGWHAEVTETHHTAKLDAPSGTAKRILAALGEAGVGGFAGAAPGGGGGAGAAPAPVPCHALRLGDAIGTHTVHLAGPGERIELTHTATRRDVFAVGALRLAQWASTQPPGLVYA